MRKSTLLAVVILLILIIGGAYALTRSSTNNSAPTPPASNSSNSSQNQSNATPPSSNTNQSSGKIEIKNMMFTPPQITVAKGGTVTWTNNDDVAHTVVADLGNGPSSGNIEPGSTYSYTFTKTGSVQYHCSIHPSMRGTIVVQ
jgi:plastocyanin